MKKYLLFFMSMCISLSLLAQEDPAINYKVTVQSAQFPGGEIEFYKYIVGKMQILYDNDLVPIGGKVIVQFSIDTLGQPFDLSIVQSLSPELDQASLEIVRGMPIWIPGTYLEKIPKITTFAIPFHFIRPKSSRD